MTHARRGAKIYFVGLLVAQILALARYTLLARLLGPEQLGLAAVLILTAQFFDVITDNGSDRFLIQDADGEDPRLQKLVQLVFVGRGAVIFAVLLVLASPLAGFYGAPQLTVALAALGIPALFMGFIHLDMRRAQRVNDFRPEGLSLLCSECCGFVALAGAALLLHNYSAVIYGLLARSLAVVAVSHLTAKRRYEIHFAREFAMRLSRFSAPLILNGILIFVGSQGDRIFVANRAGIGQLGLYSATLLLIFYPSAMILRSLMTLYLPILAGARADPPRLTRAKHDLAGLTLLLGVSMAAGFALVAPDAIVILFGQRFSPAPGVIALVGVLQTSRFMILWPTTVALANGRSGLVFGGNCVRLLAYPAALFGLVVWGGLRGILVGFTVGEVLALCSVVIALGVSDRQDLRYSVTRLALFVLVCLVVCAWGGVLGPAPLSSWPARFALALASFGLAAAICRCEARTLVWLGGVVKAPLSAMLYKRAATTENP